MSLFTIEKQKGKIIIVHLDIFPFPFKLSKLHSMTFCNNSEQLVLRLPSPYAYLCTLAREQRGKGKYKRKCQGTAHHQDLITAFGIFRVWLVCLAPSLSLLCQVLPYVIERGKSFSQLSDNQRSILQVLLFFFLNANTCVCTVNFFSLFVATYFLN